MDKLFVGDIPTTYHFARYGSNYIDLFNTSTLHNNTYDYYRVYLYDNFFTYDVGTYTVGQYNTVYLRDVPVSQEVVYRRDFPTIAFMVVMYVVVGIWFLNLFTSSIRKGGLLSGLL